ncbi:hypothetical protein CA267_011865 [Alteromonas pelagimontana]|uniref:Rhamnogalacturonan I lyase beta-sheet domain-containing protein n=1 Tax=Alteromonas pelagimontana TaxID=1858656 RepID=A0A6M4ME95_9ALTE|nr:hypothetical protein [Alteromonas pelagimontana]QJR81423.1 hypothetical protein CA267_011865 [Alteromonas pelagimontana]
MNGNSLFFSIVSCRAYIISTRLGAAFVAVIALTGCNRDLERLDQGLIVVPAEQGNPVSCRSSVDDAPKTTFNVYRNGSNLNGNPINSTTFYTDTEGEKGR